jgi:hypothetical protein
MLDRASQEAWQLYLHNWVPLGLMAALLAICLAFSSFTLGIDGALLRTFLTVPLLAAGAYGASRWNWPRLSFCLGASAQLGALFPLATHLTFIAAAANLPLQDNTLAYVDQLLGLDWKGYFYFLYERTFLIPYAYIAYAMIVWPVLGIPILLGITGHHRRLQQFVLACMLTVILTATVSTLVPAIGTYQQYAVEPDFSIFRPSGYLVQLERLPQVRDGSLRVLNSSTLGGIITFPSFHAAAAILALWSFWCIWWMRPLALMANGGMLLATPVVGGHYFIDVFAGIAVAATMIIAARPIGDWLIGAAGKPSRYLAGHARPTLQQ